MCIFNTSSITLLTTINPKARQHIHKIENVCSSTKPFPNLNDSGQDQDLCNFLLVAKQAFLFIQDEVGYNDKARNSKSPS
jgi:hypothetical protein